ncbi:MAG TPA: spore coat protein CotJB [Halanaerobiaceae bacterium]|jgi:spore coat protein JB|nr:spore coat protein CotJB [Bacillota bacterium]HHU92377.1 spore coat protein CotJB [Halanaerobiaceae bacterium]HOA39897.1 spore coat protein CotJB [Halanaerobiales bacterium]HPZ61972.1 spore coat protein CotJB [Halanaerobiales bacterium]HQD03305.1 spore coat protein CotJB [Halanaerobiales bacterium]
MTGRKRPDSINLPLLLDIMAHNFVNVEAVLFLNTHPDCQEMLELHNRNAERYHRLVDEYQKKCGPLYSNYPDATSPWRWINEPWPWEINYRR